MHAAASMKDSASRARAHPPPAVATKMPATLGPMMLAALRVLARIELARCMLARSTICGMMPFSAGRANAWIVPLTNASTTKNTTGRAVNTQAAIPACASPDSVLVTRSMASRRNRSAIPPPTMISVTIGIIEAANT